MYELKYRKTWIFLGLVFTAIIAYLSLTPLRASSSWNINDKLVHFAIYFSLTIWFVGVFKRQFFVQLGIGFLLFSYAIEVLQGRTTYRSFEWLDLLANGVGIFVAIILGLFLFGGWCQVFEKKILKVSHSDKT